MTQKEWDGVDPLREAADLLGMSLMDSGQRAAREHEVVTITPADNGFIIHVMSGAGQFTFIAKNDEVSLIIEHALGYLRGGAETKG